MAQAIIATAKQNHILIARVKVSLLLPFLLRAVFCATLEILAVFANYGWGPHVETGGAMSRSIVQMSFAVPYAMMALVVLVAVHGWQSARAGDAPATRLLTVQHLCGVYRGIVQNAKDPEQKSRVQVRVPQANVSGLWALPGSAASAPPAAGTQVWVMFEAGSVEHPVWFGSVPPGD